VVHVEGEEAPEIRLTSPCRLHIVCGEGKAVNDDQRRVVAEFMFNLAIGYLLLFTFGPIVQPVSLYTTFVYALVGILSAVALIVTGYRLLR
jgi:hypothetical protein